MTRSFPRAEEGATAVEFALILPALIMLMFGSLALAFIVWTSNIIQDAAQESARCIAQNLSACATVPATGCDTGSPSVCYVETIAGNRGLPWLKSTQVAINTNVTTGGVSFTTVTITYSISALAFTSAVAGNYSVVGYGSSPNAPY